MGLVSCDANGIINGTAEFLRSWWLKWGAIWLFWSCDTIAISISNTWCQWHCKWQHSFLHQVTSLPLPSYDGNSIVNDTKEYSLGQDDWNDVYHDFYHVTSLASAWHDTNDIINGVIVLLRPRWLKWGATWLFHHVMPLPLASCVADRVINITNEFLRSRQLKWGATQYFWSGDTIGISISNTWCQWHCMWHMTLM